MKTNWFYFSFWGSVATASKRRREALLKKVERVATRSDYPERGLYTARMEVFSDLAGEAVDIGQSGTTSFKAKVFGNWAVMLAFNSQAEWAEVEAVRWPIEFRPS